jgi:hypothetical protein
VVTLEGAAQLELAIDDSVQGEPRTGKNVSISASESMILGR